MPALIVVLLIIHIAAGAVSLIAAPVALMVVKGGRKHRLWGKVFFYAMTVIFITAILLSIYQWIPFLLMIAVFSYYSVVSGYRWLYLKKIGKGANAGLVDWVALGVTLVFNLLFLGWGIGKALQHESFFAFLAIGFGAGGLTIGIGNLISFRGSTDENLWLFKHISGMIGGYIASVTAFSSQMMTFLPGWLQWLWPTILGTPLITYYIVRYKKQLAGRKKAVEVLSLEAGRTN